MFKKLNNKKGFTLMEMLIVVAIIAILVAIAIPTMTSALEQARESADAANIRACYAEVMTKVLTLDDTATADNGAYSVAAKASEKTVGTVKLTQKETNWQNAAITNIAGVKITAGTGGTGQLDDPSSGGTVTITYDWSDNTIVFDCVAASTGSST